MPFKNTLVDGSLKPGERCQLTQRVKTPSGILCEEGHLGIVVKSQYNYTDCFAGFRRIIPYFITLDGIDGIYECNNIKHSSKDFKARES